MDQKLGHYTIVSELGRGGMGVVYKAYEESLNRYVAIKVLGEHLVHDHSFVERFVREAKAAAALSHPNVIQIFFIGREAERHYFVMEYVEGKSVHDLLKAEGALDPVRAARIVQQAASGLAAAHDRGLVHRDIKPANLLVTPEERVKIADFGLALAPSDSGARLTATHALMGTPGYLSPEQCCGEPAGPRSDIYSLGMTFYEMLTGSMPFKGESPLAVLRQILDEDPPPLLEVNPALDPAIVAVVERMVAKEPADRYPSCHELLADLEPIVGAAVVRATAGVPRPAGLPALPSSPASSTARTGRAAVAASPRDAVTETAPAPLRATAAVAAAAAGAALPPPPAAVASGGGRRWAIIGVMVVMLVVAVSAAGLFLGRSAFRDDDAGEAAKAERAEKTAPSSAAARDSLAGNEGSSNERPSNERPSNERPSTEGSSNERPSGASRPTEIEDGVVAASPSDGAQDIAGARVASRMDADVERPATTGGNAGSAAASSPASGGPGSRPAPAIAARSHAPQGGAAGLAAPRSHAGAAPVAPAAPAARQPPPRPRLRETPRVAVIAIGEPTLASAAEEALESQLARHGVELYDERGILELRDGGGAARFAPSALAEIVAERGVDVLVLVDAEALGERELRPLNQRYDYATTSRLRVDAILAADSDGIGGGWSEQIEYTGLNAATKAEQAMGRVSGDLAVSIAAAWLRYRDGAR